MVALLAAFGSSMPGTGARADDSLPPPTVAAGAQGAPFTPIVSQLVTPPTPFTGDDGRQHLAFELLLTNTSPREATVTDVRVTVTGARARVLQHLAGTEEVAASMTEVGSLTLAPTATIAPHATSQLLLDATYRPAAAAPAALTVTLGASFAAPQPGQPPYVSVYPDTVVETLPRVPVSRTEPIVIRAPLAGGDWVATNSCCALSPHRGALDGAGGRPVFAERYAIDFVRIDASGGLYQPGEEKSMASNFSYGARLLAVAPGTVVAVQKGIPDQPPDTNPTGYSLNQLGGNYVVLKLSDDLYALYAHISPATITVKVGQKVKAGQILGRLGNSGNSTAPHLHFHLMDGPGLLTSDGVPYEFERFTVVARPSATQDSFVPVRPPVVVTDGYPLTYSVIRFAGTSGASVSP